MGDDRIPAEVPGRIEQVEVTGTAPRYITYPEAGVGVEDMPNGGRALVFYCPNEVITFPMTGEAAQKIGRKLASTLIVPQGIEI